MSDNLQKHDGANARAMDRQLVEGLRHGLERNYSRIFATARREWERRFGGRPDPSDACVSVRISSYALQ
ncbi:MAG: hypothetical protein H0V56_08880 [Chthoniobacterales bacterium]|nr:hypothetical protein [Chthoniobacterales bacterium]